MVTSSEQRGDRPEAVGLRPTPLLALNFDTFQRMAIIARVCEALVRQGCRTAADVGGHPGVLADNLPAGLRCRAIIDLPICERPDHIRGSALALPLRSEAVDVALCADTLEHVGDPLGAARELLRVARRAVVISAPWKSPATDAVETTLDRWHRQLTGLPHPWLSEHRENGLPAREEVTEVFRSAGWSTAEFACGDLAEWTMLQVAMLVHDLLPVRHVNFHQFNTEYNRRWNAALTRHLPAQPYRTVLVAAKEPALIEALGGDEASTPPPAPLVEALTLIDGLFTGLQEALAASARIPDHFDSDYRERLELLTAQQAEEIERLRAEIRRLRAPREGGLLTRAVSRLTKREGA
jgi:hypothetical protein